MAWKMVGKPATHKVTHALAERYATMEPAPGDRFLKSSRVDYLTNAATGGHFRTCEWASAHCKETGKTYRVNGKHTSTAFAAMNGSLPKDIHVIAEHYECDTLEDVAKLYATFDTRNSIRTTSDINRSFAAGIEDLASIGPDIINVCVTGMSMATWGSGEHRNVGAEVRANLLNQSPDFVLWVANTIGNKSEKTRHVFRGAVVAAMFQTWQKAKKDATAFWGLVLDGSGPSHTSPDRVLHKFLLTSRVRILARAGTAAPIDNRALMAKCLHAWNAWRRNTTTDLKYHASAKMPAPV